ncbi:HTH-type transcriptional regulator MalT [Microbulbifer sp. NBRC 101763]|uniref:helix-turn-helix transcriptional regulator n=1 Tax=Microbulbifer TaxID=48073 RepID=UPI000368ED77|nr:MULTISPECIES: response regulator transcription factor [Microbulbifer]WHI52128.1 response regulator transcription factor [Microbulbifer sp. MLAF003]
MNLHKDYARLEVVTPGHESEGPEVAFLTASINLQSSIFAGRIEDEFRTKCSIFQRLSISSLEEIITEYLLLDCADLSSSDLDLILRDIHTISNPPSIVLINVADTTDLDFVLHWEKVLGLMPSECEPKVIMERLGRIFSGEYWFPRDVLHNFLRQHRKPKKWREKASNLTQRETQILQLICECHTNANIAEVLCVSEHTVKSHLYKIYRKIGCKNRLEASSWASQNL